MRGGNDEPSPPPDRRELGSEGDDDADGGDGDVALGREEPGGGQDAGAAPASSTTSTTPGQPSPTVVDSELIPGEHALSPSVPGVGRLSIDISVLPFTRRTEITFELEPSRMAAAWLVWLSLTLVVLAFWMPRHALRRLAGITASASSRPRSGTSR